MTLAEPILPEAAAVAVEPLADPRDRFFDTAHLTKDLKRRTVRGGAVTLSAQAIKFVLRMGSTAILARLLTPADFGLIAMVTVVTGFVEMFKDAGLSMATVQREKINHAQVSALFWINLTLSVLLMFAIAASSSFVASFYNDPRLTRITLILSIPIVFGGLTVQHQALLRRRMQFAKLAYIEIISMSAGAIAAIILGLFHFHYWSLVGMTVITAFVNAVACMAFCPWRPSFIFHAAKVGELLKFGGGVTGSTVASFVYRNLDDVFIGLKLGATPLGFYTRGIAILLQPWQQILIPITAVIDPVLFRSVGDPPRFRNIYRQALLLSASVTVPLAILIYLCAPFIVKVLFGPAWTQVTPLLQVMAPAALVGGVRTSHGWIHFPLGRPHRMMYWNLVGVLIFFLGICATLKHGIVAVASALSVTECVIYVGGVYFATRGTFVKPSDAFSSFAGPLWAGLFALWAAKTVPLTIAEPIVFLLTYALLVLILVPEIRQLRLLKTLREVRA